MRHSLTLLSLLLGLAFPALCRAEAQEVARVLGRIRSMPVQPPYTFSAAERIVVGLPQDRLSRFFRESLELEADQRGYFTQVPEYRVRFALETIRAHFAPKSNYEALRAAIASRTQQPGLVFEINWKAPLSFDAIQAATLNRQIALSPSKWTPSLLSWAELPKTEQEFKASLELQLNEQYLSNTRSRVLQEILAETTPNCLKSVASPSLRDLNEEFESTREKWVRQKTGIDFITVKWSSSEAAAEFLTRANLVQTETLAQFQPAASGAKRSEWNQLRASLIEKLKALSPKATWTHQRILWPLKNPTDLQSLDSRQLNYALTAPLGSVLLPAVVEGKEIWIVSGESREPQEQLTLKDPEVQDAVRRAVQQRLLAGCAQNWFTEFTKSRIVIRDGGEISSDERDQFFKALGQRGAL